MKRLAPVFVALALAACGSTSHGSPSAPDPTESADPKATCEAAGGTWRTFSNGCTDQCKPQREARGGPMACTAALTPGCDCGLADCWTGTACEPL